MLIGNTCTNAPGVDACWIDHKLPTPMKGIFAFGIFGILFVSHTIIFYTDDLSDLYYIIFGFGGALVFLHRNHSGYRIAWDDERAYMRDWGFRNLLLMRHPFHAMTFAEMDSIVGENSPYPSPMPTRLMPYQVLEITSVNPEVPNISIYATGLAEQGLLQFLLHLHEKRPDIFPEKIWNRMKKFI